MTKYLLLVLFNIKNATGMTRYRPDRYPGLELLK